MSRLPVSFSGILVNDETFQGPLGDNAISWPLLLIHLKKSRVRVLHLALLQPRRKAALRIAALELTHALSVTRSFTRVDLSLHAFREDFSEIVMEGIMHMCRHNPALMELRLSGFRVPEQSRLNPQHHLWGALLSSPRLRMLSLDNNDIGDGGAFCLAYRMKERLEQKNEDFAKIHSLELTNNILTDNCITPLCKTLATSALRQLSLANNERVGTDTVVARIMSDLPDLAALDVSGCFLSEETIDTMCMILNHNFKIHRLVVGKATIPTLFSYMQYRNTITNNTTLRHLVPYDQSDTEPCGHLSDANCACMPALQHFTTRNKLQFKATQIAKYLKAKGVLRHLPPEIATLVCSYAVTSSSAKDYRIVL